MSELDAVTKKLEHLFDAEREVRKHHADLLEGAPSPLIRASASVIAKAMKKPGEEQGLRLVRVADLLAELEGAEPVDLLIDILGSDEPEARHAAGEALEIRAFDRYKELAQGVERALGRLPVGHSALCELPYLLAPVPEPSVPRLLGRFLRLDDAEAVAAAIEAIAEHGDEQSVRELDALSGDTREVELEEAVAGETKVSIGDLALEAREMIKAGAGAPRGKAERA